MLVYKVCTKWRCGISKLLKRKLGSPAWIRTTITIRHAESVACRLFNGLKRLIGPEKPPLVRHSYTAESNPPPRHWLPDERPRRVVGIGSPGEITLAVRFFWGKCFLFSVAIKAARPCSAQAQNTLSSGSGERLSSLRMVTNSASSLSRLMISPTRFRRTPSLLRTPLYSERISSVTSQVNVPTFIQSRRNEALGFCASRRDLNPATPATSTDVSITPLGCFVRRPNRDLRQRLFPSTEAANCVRNLGFRYAGQILGRRFQGARELALPA